MNVQKAIWQFVFAGLLCTAGVVGCGTREEPPTPASVERPLSTQASRTGTDTAVEQRAQPTPSALADAASESAVPTAVPTAEAQWRDLIRKMGKLPLDAAVRYKQTHGIAPPTVPELASMCFLWPAVDVQGVMHPIPLNPQAVSWSPQPQAQIGQWLTQPEQIPFFLTLEPTELLVHYPELQQDSTEVVSQVWRRPIVTPAESNASRGPAVTALQQTQRASDLLRLPPAERTAAHFAHYRAFAGDPADARVAEAADQLLMALLDAPQSVGQPIRDWAIVERHRQSMVINLEPVSDPEEATVSIAADPLGAYRVRVRYPSGLVEDTAIVLRQQGGTLEFVPEDGASYAWTPSLIPLIQHRLVPVSSARLPGGS